MGLKVKEGNCGHRGNRRAGEWEQTDGSVGAEMKTWLERSFGDRLSPSNGSLPNTHRSQHHGTGF